MWGFYSLPVTSAPPALGGIFLAGSYVPPIGGYSPEPMEGSKAPCYGIGH
eukprot:jgi/Botrbrau1/11457/Bobra.0328s0017.1